MAISAKSKILASDVSGAVKSFSVSGKTVTYTTLGGATGTFTTQDTNTTYSEFTKATSSAARKSRTCSRSCGWSASKIS